MERPGKDHSILQKRYLQQLMLFLLLLLMAGTGVIAGAKNENRADSSITSTLQEAIAYIDAIPDLPVSEHWPNIKPSLFLDNLRSNIHHPLSPYPGMSTNFCGYGALTYLFLQDDPLGYAKLLLQLYSEGKAVYEGNNFEPSEAIKKGAGRLKYKGILDIHPAEQMWYLTLADHFKGYLNLSNRNYDPGDEDRFWASCNYAKFNRMVKKLLHYGVIKRGADLVRPGIKRDSLFSYISDKMKKGIVVLYINNRIVHKKNHVKLKLAVPTHFVVAERISYENGVITLVYWDYGSKTLIQLSPSFLKSIIFGISCFTRNEKNDDQL